MVDFSLETNGLIVTSRPPQTDLDALLRALVDSRPSDLEERRVPIASFIRDSDGQLIGGVAGHTHFGWLFIAQLWVADSTRGRGLGGSLLLTTEAEARKRGCHSAWLDTYSYQARSFYEAHGYSLFGRLDCYPGPHAKEFLAKEL